MPPNFPYETRADRVRAIREALGADQATMADALNAAAERLGVRLRGRYDKTVISKLENHRRDLSVDDVVLYAELDPKRRGMGWIAQGADEEPFELPMGPADIPMDLSDPAAKKRPGRGA